MQNSGLDDRTLTTAALAHSAKRADTPSVLRKRRSDHDGCYFRCSRYFSVGHEWYAAMREGEDLGPFMSAQYAELEAAAYIADRSETACGQIEDTIRSGERDATAFEVLVHEFWICRQESAQRSETAVCAWAKRRLDDLEEDPKMLLDAAVRASALKHFLSELDR